MKSLSAPVALMAGHDLTGFDCGETALNDWLKHRAQKNESRYSRTYVVCEDDRVVAYSCISAGAVERLAAPGNMRRNAPTMIPISIIGRLAVDTAYGGRGLGAGLLADAFRRIAVASQTIGIGAIVVQAKNEQAKNFYLGCANFVEYPADSRTLFLSIEAVMAEFG